MRHLLPERWRRLRLLSALVILACTLTLFQTAIGQEVDSTATFAEYRERLLSARSALMAGQALSTVQQDLSTIGEVQLASGDTITVTPLLEDAVDVDSALRRLAIVLSQMELSASDRSEERLAQLDTVRARYNLDRPSFWDRIWRWLGDLFDALTPDDVPSGAGAVAEIGSRIVVWLIVLSGGALLAILLSYWLRRMLGGVLGDRLRQRKTSGDEIPVSAAEARTQAQTLAGTGNYRAAVRQLYLAALLHLDEQGLLRFQRDQTNREVLAQTRPDTDVYAHLKPAVETFDRVWYGEREPDHPTFESYRAEIDELMARTAEDKRD